MLRRRTLVVTAILLCGVLALPLLNVAARLQGGKPLEWSGAALFDTKVQATGWLNATLYRWGISTAPRNVVIGREGWLYLGDGYEATITATRRGETAADVARASSIGAAAQAWDAWLRQRGVKAYRVLVGPNKSSVYPEYLPLWAAPAPAAPVDALFAHARPWYVDPRPALLQAKAEVRAPLYYVTDTHWTQWGGSVAFGALAQGLAPQAPDLHWPDQHARAVLAVRPHRAGDLANFLQLTSVLRDEEPLLGISESGTPTLHCSAGRGYQPVGADSCSVARLRTEASPDIFREPVRVVSPRALNARKVLWLHDSFGEALAPLMAATFTETLHMRWDKALRLGLLARAVEAWHPDYVIVTVVERSALSELFTLLPPGADTVSLPAASRP